MRSLYLMHSRIRALLMGVGLFAASNLAVPGAGAGEPAPDPALIADTGTEPAAAVPAEDAGVAPVLQQPVASDGAPVDATPDVDLWAEFFAAPVPPARTEPGSRGSAPSRAQVSTPPAASAKTASTYQIQQNDHVQFFLDQFQTGYRRAVVERWFTRSGRYLPMALDVFRQKGLPEELVFTAMIESGFNPVAVSRVGAKGMWQFMAPTARRYGLRVDRWLDERLDPEKSTVAAANYLKDLYSIFGSWELVQAAYNAGEMKVLRAIQGTGSRDFWSLTQTRFLMDETKNFVPAIHAVAIIGKGPEQYGFAVTPEEPLSYEQITVPRATSLKHVASVSGIPFDELIRLNSELRLKQTPPDAPYHLKVPLGSAVALQTGLDREAEAHRSASAARTSERGKRRAQVQAPAAPAGIHVVQPRETIDTIAKRYGVSAEQLVRWNDLERGARIFPGDRLRVASAAPRREEPEQGGFR
jgi:membrane-bound lytic murein transglycosylase D